MEQIEPFIIECVTRVANARRKKNYPLMDNHFNTADVRLVCEVLYELSKKLLEDKKK